MCYGLFLRFRVATSTERLRRVLLVVRVMLLDVLRAPAVRAGLRLRFRRVVDLVVGLYLLRMLLRPRRSVRLLTTLPRSVLCLVFAAFFGVQVI